MEVNLGTISKLVIGPYCLKTLYQTVTVFHDNVSIVLGSPNERTSMLRLVESFDFGQPVYAKRTHGMLYGL